MSKKDKRLSFSFSNENVMLGCLEDILFKLFTINLFIEFVVKHKNHFFGGHSKRLTKNILRDLRAISKNF